MSNTTEKSTSPLLQLLIDGRRGIAVGLYVLAVVLTAVAAWLFFFRDRAAHLPLVLWCALLALLCVVVNLVWPWLQQRGSLTRSARAAEDPGGRLGEADVARLMVLVFGGAAGFLTALLGAGLAYQWWEVVGGGWKVWQGDQGKWLWVVIGVFLAGLMLMFFSLQLARADERSSAGLRRLLYGYNAVLTGLLLLAILAVVNLLTFVDWKEFGRPWRSLAFLNGRIDWTTKSIYSLSDKSEKILVGLDRPLQIYAILRGNDPHYDRVQALLDNVSAANREVKVEFLSPDLNQQEVKRLAQEYKFSDSQGLLVVYGSGSKAVSHFVKYGELFEAPTSFSMEQRTQLFNGEGALLSAINFMTEGKEKPVLYFTQGQGEMDLRDSQPRSDMGLATLKQRLENRGFYQVKGLRFTPDDSAKPDTDPGFVTSNRVPDDASVVVVAGPRKKFPAFAEKALREYLSPPDPLKEKKDGKQADAKDDMEPKSKKGTLIVLLNITPNEDQTAVEPTGLEGLLADYNVRVGNDIILHDPRADGQPPQRIIVQTPESTNRASLNPIAAAFAEQFFLMSPVRTVQPVPQAQGNNRFQTEVILETPLELRAWAETDLRANINQLILSGQVRSKLSSKPLSVAVAVAESDSPVPRDEFHRSARQRTEEPRLVVYGNATWAGNPNMTFGSSGARYYDLFTSSLAWLRDRPTGIGIEPKKSDTYVMNPNVNVSRIAWLPAVFAVVGIVGLGTGVWIVRRR